MADPIMPQDMIDWMRNRNWGEHHDQWHVERRWDYYSARAQQGDAGASEVMEYAQSMGWQRTQFQEGQRGNGLEFLGMHRAMLLLLLENFAPHANLLQGWDSPPQDPTAPDDPVPSGEPFEEAKSQAITLIEDQPEFFSDEEDFGLFIQTNLRPTSANPLARSSDAKTGIHNYLHNRWSNVNSEINLGDPTVNIFNQRFWRLHGWIDKQWSRFRMAKGLSDDEPAYVQMIVSHRHMMEHPHHPHHFALDADNVPVRPDLLRRAFD